MTSASALAVSFSERASDFTKEELAHADPAGAKSSVNICDGPCD